MIERTTETQITFEHPFVLDCLVAPLQAGTYRLVVDEELIEGLSFSAYRRVGTHLEIPAISTVTATRQFLQVSAAEIESALLKDAGYQLADQCSRENTACRREATVMQLIDPVKASFPASETDEIVWNSSPPFQSPQLGVDLDLLSCHLKRRHFCGKARRHGLHPSSE